MLSRKLLPPLIVFNPMNTKNSAPDAPFPMIFWQSAVLFLFSLGLMQRIVLSLLGQESDRIIIQFCLYMITVLAVQIAICWFIARRQKPFVDKKKRRQLVPHWRDSRRIFSAALTLNLLGLLLSYTIFTGFFWYWRLLILAALFLVFGEIFIRAGRAIFIGLTLLCLSFNIETGFQIWQKTHPPSVQEYDWRAAFDKKFKPVQLTQKPNIYLVSWDALAPEQIFAKYLEIPPGILGYARFLNNGEFRVFKNAFVDRIAYPSPQRQIDPFFSDGSRAFHNSLLLLDPNLWERQTGNLSHLHRGYDFPGQTHYFSGRRRSPVYEIFKENGYQIFVSYQSEYFGRKGPHIDEYLIPPDNKGQCAFALPWQHLQSLGFCLFRRFLGDDWQPHSPAAHMQNILSILRQQAQNTAPFLAFIYVNSPGHTQLDYHHKPHFKQRYTNFVIPSSQKTAQYMGDILEMIKTHDSEALILFFGDHGAAMSRQLRKNDLRDDDTKRFYFLDIHAVMAALYPKNACAEYMNFAGDYVTISMLVRALIVCLADGDDPIDWEVDYSQPYDGIRFADYLYE